MHVWTFSSQQPGPHVCINALTHGNEICGAQAVLHVLSMLRTGVLRPQRGCLSLCLANVAAYALRGSRPLDECRWVDEDFNRLWQAAVLNGPRDSTELRRARALQPFYATVDYLLDLHSMHTPGLPLALCGMTQKGLQLACAVAAPGLIVMDAGHASGTRLRDYADFANPNSAKTALLMECGAHDDPNATTVAIQATLRFLAVTGCISLACAPAPQSEVNVVEITDVVPITRPVFRFTADWQTGQTIAQAGTVLGYDGDQPLLTPYTQCVLIMPAPLRYQQPGLTAIRLGRWRPAARMSGLPAAVPTVSLVV